MNRQCSISKNMTNCNCTYQFCNRKGNCCDCMHYHRKRNELPACYFDNENEKTFDRSIKNFIKNNSKI